MGIARNLARLVPNGSGLLPNANIEAVAASKLTGQVADANAPSGSVIQVIQSSITSAQIAVSPGLALVSTGISQAITPQSTSSKILVIPVMTNVYNNGTGGFGFSIYRGATNIYNHGYAQAGGYLGSLYNDGNDIGNVTYPYLDSPSTASAVTYTIYVGTYGSAGYINYNGAATVNGTGSYITLMEIAG